MLERCGRLWLSRRWPQISNTKQSIPQRITNTTTTRLSSSKPSPSPSPSQPPSKRKFPSSDSRSSSKTLQYLALGTATIGVAAAAYQYYDSQRVASSFKTYTLVSRESVSSTASVFRLRPKDPGDTIADGEAMQEIWRQGVWNVLVKQPQIQIVRAYTPLPPVLPEAEQQRQGENISAAEKSQTGELQFLIRRDPHGEVSSYLHRLPVGADIELRGPNLEYAISPDVRQVVFYAGGTGIATALQVAHAMFDGEQASKKKLHILWASRKREDCVGGISDGPSDEIEETASPKTTWSGLFSSSSKKSKSQAPLPTSMPSETSTQDEGKIVQQLNALKRRYPGQITVSYFVNAEGTYIDDDAVLSSLSHFDISASSNDAQQLTSGASSKREAKQIIISGPNGFISYLAGPKEWSGGREIQGDVKSVVAHAVAKRPVEGVKIWKI